jgi:predicted DNA-binding transcriptional regulator YafY
MTKKKRQRQPSDDLLERIREAALERRCLELSYGGKRRLIEPYALRLAKDGSVLLSARKAETRQLRTYRLDRIEQVQVTDQKFAPVFTAEMSEGGQLLVFPPRGMPLRPGKLYPAQE